MDAFVKNLKGLDMAISDCMGRSQYLPALVLIYAGMDVVASAERSLTETVQQSFTRWGDAYLLPSRQLGCTSLELYAARCGMVHTLTAASDLSRRGKVRTICYAWGNAKADELNSAIRQMGKAAVGIHINDLQEAFHLGLLNWIEEVSADATRRNQVTANKNLWFVNLVPGPVRQFLTQSSKQP